MKLFITPLARHLSECKSKMTNSISNLPESEVLSYNQRLIDDIFNRYKINKSLEIKELIDSDVIMAKDYSRKTYAGGFYEYAVVIYTYKIEGDKDLLNFKPSNFMHITNEIEIYKDTLILNLETNYGNKNLSEDYIKGVKSQRDNIIGNIKSNIKNLTEEIEDFNKKLASEIEKLLEKRKAEIESHNEVKKKLM